MFLQGASFEFSTVITDRIETGMVRTKKVMGYTSIVHATRRNEEVFAQVVLKLSTET